MVPSFTVSDIVTFFKRNNFRVEIRFSQVRHAISDFCCFKRPVFFYATYLKFVSPKPLLNLCEKRNVLRELRTPQGFRHLPETIKNIFEKNFPQFSVFQRFFVEKDVFFCCFQLEKNGFRDLCVSFRVFLRCIL